MLLVYHVYEFLFKEVNVLVAALVGSSLNGSLELMFCPGFGIEFDKGVRDFCNVEGGAWRGGGDWTSLRNLLGVVVKGQIFSSQVYSTIQHHV